MSQFEPIRTYLMQALPFVRHVGIELEHVGLGTARATLAHSEQTSNHIGTQHAGAMFTLAETASGGAMASTIAPLLMNARPVAAEATINYVKIAKGTLTAHAQTQGDPVALLADLTEIGKVTFTVDVRIVDETEEDVATLSVLWHVKRNS